MTPTVLILTISLLTFALALGATATIARAETASPPVAQSINAFACDLYGQLAKGSEGKNLFFSPFSMGSALAMTAEGARGRTTEEMRRVLHADRSPTLDALHEGLGSLAGRLGERPVPSTTRDKIAALRKELDATNKAVAAVDRWDQKTADLHEKAERLAKELNALQAQVDQYELRSANALWGERSFSFERAYLDTIAKFYKTGGLFPVDFRNDPDGSRQRINAWVAGQTRDRIKDLIAPGQVRADTRLVLTNAVYFKGQWSDPFAAAETKEQDFTTGDGKTVRVPLMHKYAPAGARYAAFNADGSPFPTPDRVPLGQVDRTKAYPAADGFLAVELPYKGGDLSMLVLLPQSAKGLAKLEANLSAERLSALVGAMTARDVDVYLPKFRMETSYDMVGPLASLGMKRAFVNPVDPDGAEFDGISPSADLTQRLYVGAVVHKAFVDVNEQGTEAAAATAVMMRAGSMAPTMVPFVPEFRADRPFLLLIRETAGGTVLFMGRVTNPGG